MATVTPLFNRIAITLTFGTLLCACNTPPGHDPVAAGTQMNPDPTVSTTPLHEVASRKNAMTPLNQLLLSLAGQAAPWGAFDHVSGVQWRDAKPQANPDAPAPDLAYDRSGTLMLSGFGMVDVPDGQRGAEAGTKQDNEGHAGVTLSGNAELVQSVAVLKFYPSKNYQDILQKQFGSSVAIRSVADACALDYGTTSANTQDNTFYQITLGSAPTPLYAEASIDDGTESHGPGSTTFVFYRSKPTQRIAAMHCKEH
jgi:hypothetical protein